MTPSIRKGFFGVRGGHQGAVNVYRPFSNEVAQYLETAEGNVFSFGSGHQMSFGTDSEMLFGLPYGASWELSPSVCAGLKTMEYDRGGNQHKYVALGEGLNGTVFANLGPGSEPWDEMITEVTAAYAALTPSAQRQVRAYSMHVTHGEADSAVTPEATYEANLETWRTNWRNAMNAITGRADEPKLFLDMMNYTSGSGLVVDDTNRRNILRAQRDFGDTTHGYVVGPKASIALTTVDLIHYADQQAYHYMGEQHAKVAYRVIELAENWKPLRYTSITARPRNVVRVALNVPRGRAVLDQRRQRQSGFYDGQLKGFTYKDDGTARIIGIDVQSNFIDLQLDAAPSTNPTLTHGYCSLAVNGQVGMPRIYVRDQDTEFKSFYNEPLYNWLCPFIREPVV